MTSFKFLVISCAMALMAWNPAQAATDTDSTSEVTGTPSTTTGTTTHHRRHHKTTGSGTDSTNSATSSSSEETTSKTAKSSKTGRTASDKTETSKTASTTEPESSTGKTGSGSTSGKTSETTSASTTGKSHTLRKRHTTGTETAAKEKTSPENETKPEEGAKTAKTSTTKSTPTGENSSSTPKTSAASNAPSAGGAAAAAATVVNGKTAVATQGKGRHHRHGKAETPSLPEPPIVISTVNVPPLSSAPAAPPLGLPAVSSGVVPTVVTSLPVPRPGSGTTATFALVRNPGPPVNTHFPFIDLPSRTHIYPWKRRIITTVFWIGEGSTPMSSMTNRSSAWDINWVHDNGGADDQYDMSGYGSGSHASLINPFYVALPFNDLAYPDKTERWLPPGWYKSAHHGEKQQSSCQGRWIEIKNAAGRSCFAQWEDVGPVVTDDAEYVFGSAPPSASRGLDVSPAVSKYLGFDSTAYTSWRFVDDDDVPPGLWLRYNEQAILFQALKDQARRGTPIQDLSQPVPDGADDSHSEKEIRAGRG
jgi:hypothetical protein